MTIFIANCIESSTPLYQVISLFRDISMCLPQIIGALRAANNATLFYLRNSMAPHLYDHLVLLRILLIILHSLVEPILLQLSQPAFRSFAIGLILLIIMATSIIEIFLIYTFHMIRLALVVVLVSLLGASLLTWLGSDVPGEPDGDNSSGSSAGTDTNQNI